MGIGPSRRQHNKTKSRTKLSANERPCCAIDDRPDAPTQYPRSDEGDAECHEAVADIADPSARKVACNLEGPCHWFDERCPVPPARTPGRSPGRSPGRRPVPAPVPPSPPGGSCDRAPYDCSRLCTAQECNDYKNCPGGCDKDGELSRANCMSSDGQMLSDDYRYVCTSPHVNHPDGMNKEVGACSRMRPYWCNDDECADCCDRKFCNSMPPAPPPPPPAPRPTPVASGCSRVCNADEQAAMAAQGVMCGASAPYMCRWYGIWWM